MRFSTLAGWRLVNVIFQLKGEDGRNSLLAITSAVVRSSRLCIKGRQEPPFNVFLDI